MDLKNSDSGPLNIAANNIVMYISCIFSGVCFLLAAITLQLTVKVNTYFYNCCCLIIKKIYFEFSSQIAQ